jgi:tRNA pseudouridine38-40 synthase
LIRDTEWLSLKVHGQSFMMHQIRKMVGMAVMLVRTATDKQVFDQSFEEPKMPVPTAPSLGLLLERPVFESYNAKFASGGERDPVEFTPYNDDIEAFKQRYIYDEIVNYELEHNE